MQVAGFRLRVVGGFRFPVHGNGRPRFQVAGPNADPLIAELPNRAEKMEHMIMLVRCSIGLDGLYP